MDGTIFDIKEFALNDGPGMRVTVFLKGCPLSCKWCHNPEGIDFKPQKNLKTGRIVGKTWTVDALVRHVMKFKEAYDLSGGGVTFSGGEPTAQFEFLQACGERLKTAGVHLNLDTSGYCDPSRFRTLLETFHLVFFDIKVVDEAKHREFTGVSNQVILENLRVLSVSGVPYHVRVPLIPGMTDTKENRSEIKALIDSLSRQPENVDWLPYNTLAGGKYPIYGMAYPLEEDVKC